MFKNLQCPFKTREPHLIPFLKHPNSKISQYEYSGPGVRGCLDYASVNMCVRMKKVSVVSRREMWDRVLAALPSRPAQHCVLCSRIHTAAKQSQPWPFNWPGHAVIDFIYSTPFLGQVAVKTVEFTRTLCVILSLTVYMYASRCVSGWSWKCRGRAEFFCSFILH